LGFVIDGLQRLLTDPAYRQKQSAIKARIRQKYAAELKAATSYWERVAVKGKMKREIREAQPSPYCLWSTAPLAGCLSKENRAKVSRA
jgi:hypothetical protein